MTQTAIYYHSDAVETEGKDLVGRRVAGQSFLEGYLAHVPGETVQAVTDTKQGAEQFDAVARALGETRQIEVATLRGGQDFSRFGTIFFPAPGYRNAGWIRQRFGQASCSLVGVTHTVSTRRVMENLHALMAEPVAPWDAIICTSRAVQSVVARQFEAQAEFVRHQFGASRVPQPQLPVIPLGINAQSFAAEGDARRRMRARFNVPQDAVVILTMGRLTSVEKANPVPLFLALAKVAARVSRPVHLWMVGWAQREAEEALHRAGAAALCPAVTTTFIDGRDEVIRREIRSGADIFTLPVDSIQETFGLAPVEAMAAGLPVVMPDWDGFRDTVRNGETGMLVPTRACAPGQPAGRALAARFADGRDDYLRHLAVVQQHIQIDVRAYADALSTLVEDEDLRARLGAAATRRVLDHYDWRAVIPQYLSLAQDLQRQREAAPKATADPMPLEIDPFALYAGYPSQTLAENDFVTSVRPLDQDGLTALDALNGRALYGRRTVSDARMIEAASVIASHGPLTVADTAATCGMRMDVMSGVILFLAKFDFVSIAPQASK